MNTIKNAAAAIAVCGLITMGANAEAACSKATLDGNYAAYLTFPDTDNFFPSSNVVMLQFNGSGNFTILKGVEVFDNLERYKFTGFGNYSLNSNCTGAMAVNLREDGVVVARGKIDFVVGGTMEAPELLGHYFDRENGRWGQLRAIKSSI